MYKNQLIQQKITRTILLTSTVVLLLTGLAYVIHEFVTYKEAALNRLSVLARVIANNSTAALAFYSPVDAEEILKALRAEENIVTAVLFNEEGELFASYARGSNTPDSLSRDFIKTNNDYYFANGYLHGIEPVVLGSKQIGTLYIQYDLTRFYRQLLYFGIVAIFIFLVSLLLAYFLSAKLQKRISMPIIALASVARTVATGKDYSIRAIKQSNDEIGILTDAFNQMLTQIGQQSHALKENEKHFRAVADNIAQMAWMTDQNGTFTWYNKRWYDYTGTTFDIMNQGGWKNILQHEQIDRIIEKFNNAIETGTTWDDTFLIKGSDGIYRWFLSRAVPIKNEEGEILHWFGTNTDITGIMEVEAALRKSEGFNRSLMESSPDCVISLDFEGKILSVNRQGQEMLGIDDVTGFVGSDWLELWPEEHLQLLLEAMGKAKAGEVGHFIGYSYNQQGKFKWWDVLIAPVYGAAKEVERLISVARDITFLKLLEKQKDDFIGIASHELKTPVTVIKAYTQVLHTNFEKVQDTGSLVMLSKLDGQLDKLSNLINDLLDVTKIEQGNLQLKKENFSFNDIVHELVEEIQGTTKKHKIIKDLSDNIIISGDRERIGQVLINYLTNAIKYSPKASTIAVRSEVNKDMLIISVHDEGLGLTPEDAQKVFNQFFRVQTLGHETYPGLGLGLYISAEIIRRHDGQTWVESTKGRGSVFYFSLPLNTTDWTEYNKDFQSSSKMT